MRTIFDPKERRALLRRIDLLTPGTPARWGRMNAHQMVCHLIDAIESGFKDVPVSRASGPLARFPINWLVINVLPWPRGKLQSPPDLLQRKPAGWSTDVAGLRAWLERASDRGPHAPWPPTDVFGAISGRQWGALLRTHIDHHLRQFGV
jgi:hypothetical protein